MKYEGYIEETRVPTLSFRSLCAKHQVGDVSLLQIDTEGYDFEILKMVFETNVKPQIINYEHEHLSPADNLACKTLLLKEDYYFIRNGKNVLAIHGGLAARWRMLV